MRISDWSSDVCSSDLRDADLVQRGDRRRDVLVAADAVDAREQRGDRLRAIGLDRGHVQAAGPEVAEQFLHMVLRRLHRRVEQVALLLLCKVAQLAQGRDRAGALDDDVGRQPVLVRSEAHTSELQSLMRISYAVFCLKKKTNIKR